MYVLVWFRAEVRDSECTSLHNTSEWVMWLWMHVWVSGLISLSFYLSISAYYYYYYSLLLERSVQMSASHPSHALTHCLVKSFGIIKHHHLILLTGYLLLPLTITAPSTLISICFCILLLCHFFHHFLASFFFLLICCIYHVLSSCVHINAFLMVNLFLGFKFTFFYY